MSLRNSRANRSCVTNVTGLLPAFLLWCSINKTVFGSYIKRSFKRNVKFGGNCFQTELLSRLSHKVCRLFPPGSAVPLRKFTSDNPAKFETQRANSCSPLDQRLWSAFRVVIREQFEPSTIYSSLGFESAPEKLDYNYWSQLREPNYTLGMYHKLLTKQPKNILLNGQCAVV